MAISDKITEEILRQTDILEIISEYVELKKRGKNFIGLCPFHNEKTPSFNVSSELGIFKCFGCGKSGNVISFLIEHNGMSFPEAKKYLAQRLGIDLESEKKSNRIIKLTKRELILNALEKSAGFYAYYLNTKQGEIARRYLAKRNFTNDTINKFNLGYSPDIWDGLLQSLTSKGLNPQILSDAGLIIEKEQGGYYDRFRNRIMFPIKDHFGKIIGFGGRTLESDSNQAKYINSPQTMVYDKSATLYGLFEAKKEIINKNYVILVEGYADVITLHQAGIINVVASSGTSLTKEQINLLNRFCKKIYFVFDSDSAGLKATERGIELALVSGFSSYIINLPAGEDPDSFIRNHSRELFETYLNSAISFVDFKTDLFKKSGYLDSPEGIAQSARQLINIVSLIPDPLQHDIYINKIEKNLKLSREQLKFLYDEKNKSSSTHKKSNINIKGDISIKSPDAQQNKNTSKEDLSSNMHPPKRNFIEKLHPAEKLLIQLAITQNEFLYLIKAKFKINSDELITEEAKILFNIVSSCSQQVNILNDIMMNEDIEISSKDALSFIAFQDTQSENWSKFTNIEIKPDYNRIIEDIKVKLEITKIEQLISDLKINTINSEERNEINQLLQEIQRLQQRKEFLIRNLDYVEKRSLKSTQ